MEKEFSIKEMLAQCIKSWWLVFLCVAVLGGAGAAYGMKKGNADPLQVNIQDASASLTEAQKNLVDATFAQYTYYLEQDTKYGALGTSGLLQMNPYTATVLHMTYIVESDLGNTIDLYRTFDFNEEERNRVKELLELSAEENAEDYFVISSESSSNAARAVMLIDVYCPSKANTEALESFVNAYMVRKTNEWNEKGLPVATSFSAANVTTGYNEYLFTLQEDYQTNYKNAYDMFSSLEKPAILKGDELSYYQALMAEYYGNTATESSGGRKTVVKYSVLGIFGGLLLSLLFVSLRYMNMHSLHTEKDVEMAGAGPTLAQVVSKSKKNTLVVKLVSDKPMTVDELSVLTVKKVQEDLKVIQGKKLFLFMDEENEELISVFKSQMQESVSITYGNPCNNAEAYASLSDADAVLFVIQAYASKDTDVLNVVEAAKKNQTKILGSILVKNI